ncbi:MAG: DUF3301 domain-containing protein [Pseudomonadales bacterium]|nr:DUF3301 domain-containing protein [Pseudomonadales bacterium]NRA16574.1 DUF3301 domain-containing protein [Oceanospirillaceae bacterium]
MYFELFDVFVVTLLCLAIFYWINGQKIRELALIAARAECKRLDLQLLDGSVSLKKIRPKRGASGQLTLRREYHFEFSATGDERYQGKVILIGVKVELIQLQPHRIV